MSRESTILFLGTIVAVTQFLGLPSSWENIIFFFCGAAIAVFAFLLRRQRSMNLFSPAHGRETEMYTQNGIPGNHLS